MQKTITLLANDAIAPQPINPKLGVMVYAGAWPCGDCYSHAFIWAETEAEAEAAADCYRHMTKSPMDTGARMERAIALFRGYGAEARHQLRRDSDACVEWFN